jgi:hypothetical protein
MYVIEAALCSSDRIIGRMGVGVVWMTWVEQKDMRCIAAAQPTSNHTYAHTTNNSITTTQSGFNHVHNPESCANHINNIITAIIPAAWVARRRGWLVVG